MREKNKGQVFSTDIMVAVGIFLLLLGFCFITWNGIVRTADIEINREKSYEAAFQILDTMVRSPGIPSVWNWSNVQTVGLAKNDYILDTDKVVEFFDMSQGNVTEVFQIEGFNYTMYMMKNLVEVKMLSKWEDIGYYYKLESPEPLDTEPCCEMPAYNPNSCTGEDISLCRYVVEELTDSEINFYRPTELDNLLDDLNQFGVVIFEDTNQDSGDFGGRQSELTTWVSNGGVVIATGDVPFIRSLFGIGGSGRGNAEGTIEHLGNPKILDDVKLGWCYEGGYQGSKMDVGSCTEPGDPTPGTCHDFIGLIEKTSGEFYALQADYGDQDGMVYTLVSPYGNLYDSCGGSLIQENFAIASGLFKTEIELSGSHPINASEFDVVGQRYAILDGHPVVVELHVWR